MQHIYNVTQLICTSQWRSPNNEAVTINARALRKYSSSWQPS